jgi:glycerate kinase
VASSTVLLAAEAFGGKLDAARTARAIGRGLGAGDPGLETDLCPIGTLETDLCPIGAPAADLPQDIDARMRKARAVVIAAAHLDHETLLRGDAVSEIATRARQAGVPCYAVAGSDELDLFEARILDLQVVLEARGESGLRSAGRKLAGMV